MKKNELTELEITDLTAEGNGVGRHEGIAVFVPGAAVGDRLRVKIVKVLKSYAYGIIDEILAPSADRIVPDCEYFPKCGGCTFRHMTYDAELRFKEKLVYDAFTRLGKINTEFLPILGCETPERYRNKAQYPVGQSENGMICGFYAKRSHRIINGTDCKLLPDIFAEIMADIIKYSKENNIPPYDEQTGKGLLRHIFIRQGRHSGEIMVCLILKKDRRELFEKWCSEASEKFPEIKSIVININPDKTNVILGKKTAVLYGNETISDTMCQRNISISAQSFYQVNTLQAEKLYGQAEEFAKLDGTQTVIDLYCGAGTVGLSMIDKVKRLIGVEIVPQAVKNAKKNAEKNSITNAEFICSDAGKAAEQLMQSGETPDVILIDPPRKGSDKKTLDAMVKMQPERIVMISCNPSTAARDCSYLEENGYKTIKVRAVDMFPRTGSVECVSLIIKEKNRER